jgi:HD-GYP domain-containing protein (c-di-GMP phosphodiesterase class II)
VTDSTPEQESQQQESPQQASPDRRSDTYLGHLLKVSIGDNPAVATEDIYNQFGVLLITEGTPLNPGSAARLHNHTLEKPVDDVLALSERFDSEALLGKINEFVQSHPDLEKIQQSNRFEDALRHLILSKDIPPALLQQLTVMESRLPEVFQRALFSAWMGAMIASTRRLDTETVYLVFLAGLFHDLGLLHIDEEIIAKTGDYTPEDWKAVKSHVIIGKMIIENLNHYPDKLATAVMNHHERDDGAGYPRGLSAGSLDPLSQIIAMTDMLYDQRFKELLITFSNLGDCLPYLRVNTKTFTEENYAAMSRILRTAELDSLTGDASDAASLTKVVNQALASVTKMLEQLEPLEKRLTKAQQVKSLASASRLIDQIHAVIKSSGISIAEHTKWLESVSGDANDHVSEIHDLHITLHELLWLGKRVARNLAEYGESCKDPDADIEQINSALQQELDKAWALYS